MTYQQDPSGGYFLRDVWTSGWEPEVKARIVWWTQFFIIREILSDRAKCLHFVGKRTLAEDEEIAKQEKKVKTCIGT